MSWPGRSVQDQRRRTDCAIHRACMDLASDPLTFTTFQRLVLCARKRAPRLFEAPVFATRHPGVDALVNLSRRHASHLRSIDDWPGTCKSWRPAIASLANHLVSNYKVPPFLASAWYATDAATDQKQCWFIAHSRGASFRSLNLPIAMTRKMEHIFLASNDHLQIEYALRRAELLSLGMAAEHLKAIMQTRLANDLGHGEFWRTFWNFLVVNSSSIDPAQIGPMIDYVQAIRHEHTTMATERGMVELAPPEPAFSLKGRTPQSMSRLVRDWHRSLGKGGIALSWMPSPFEPSLMEEQARDGSEKPKRWQMTELTNSAQLRTEGAALHHCVASYANVCRRGASSIWSLRLLQGEKVHHVLTIEVDVRKRTVVQARSFANRLPAAKPLRLLKDWADRERLKMAI